MRVCHSLVLTASHKFKQSIILHSKAHAHTRHSQEVASLLLDVAALSQGTQEGAIAELQQNLGSENEKVGAE